MTENFSLYESIACPKGRESILEDLTLAVARKGAFDHLLPAGAIRNKVKHGRRGCADVEVQDTTGKTLLGIEIKVSSQVNWAYYGGSNYVSQFDQMSKVSERLIIITSTSRARKDTWPTEALVITTRDLAELAREHGITADSIIAVSLGA